MTTPTHHHDQSNTAHWSDARARAHARQQEARRLWANHDWLVENGAPREDIDRAAELAEAVECGAIDVYMEWLALDADHAVETLEARDHADTQRDALGIGLQ